MIRRHLFTTVLVLACALALGFLLLPLVAIFLRVPPGDLFAQLGSEAARDAIVVTLKTTLIAQALILLVGTPAAYLIASHRFRGRPFVITLVELPLVLRDLVFLGHIDEVDPLSGLANGGLYAIAIFAVIVLGSLVVLFIRYDEVER